MNFGYSDIQNIIYKQAIQAKYPMASKFAKDTAKRIWAMIEEKEPKMNLEWNGVHGFPMELEPFARRLERLFGFPMMRDEIAIDAYRWIIEQEETGKTAKKFYAWASDPERVKYIGKYKNPGQIKNDYVLAFEQSGNNPQQLEVSF